MSLSGPIPILLHIVLLNLLREKCKWTIRHQCLKTSNRRFLVAKSRLAAKTHSRKTQLRLYWNSSNSWSIVLDIEMGLNLRAQIFTAVRRSAHTDKSFLSFPITQQSLPINPFVCHGPNVFSKVVTSLFNLPRAAV